MLENASLKQLLISMSILNPMPCKHMELSICAMLGPGERIGLLFQGAPGLKSIKKLLALW